MIAEVTVVLPLPELAAPIKKRDKLDILFDDFFELLKTIFRGKYKKNYLCRGFGNVQMSLI